MKLPSLQALVNSTFATCKRFPLAIFFVIIACWYCIRLNHLYYNSYDDNRHYVNVVMSAYIGMLLALVTVVFCESRAFSGIGKLVGVAVVLILTGIFYYLLPPYHTPISTMRFILFALGLHLLLAFIPFISKGGVNGFWQYNKSIFIRIITVAVYSIVLYLGLALALLAVDKLFAVNVSGKWYTDLWVIIAGMFNTVFFLAGFPSGFEKLEYQTDYPKGLKIFTQYVLIPIISIYLLILYAYMFKIIVSRQWPYGWVSYLVLAFAVAGILSLLLIHPVRNEAGNKWTLLFSRFFYFALCPLMVMLFLSIEKRIHAYGVTEERYFVMALACWLSFIALYFLFSKSRNIKIIPMSLCILTFLASFGPWSAFSVSLNSQRNRLQLYLLMNNMLQGGKAVTPATANLHKGDATQISSIVKYMLETHGRQSLQPLFTQNLDTLLKIESSDRWDASYQQTQKLLAFMRVDENDDTNGPASEKYFNLSSVSGNTLTSIAGYDYMVNYNNQTTFDENGLPEDYSFSLDRQPVIIRFLSDSGKLLITTGGVNAISLDMKQLVRSLNQNNYTRYQTLKQDSLTLLGENSELLVKCLFHDISGTDKRETTTITRFNADLLLKLKHPKIQQ